MRRLSLEGERDVALEKERVDLVSERERDEDDVDVGRDDLLARRVGGRVARRAPRELRSAGEDCGDQSFRVERYPVAHGGKLGAFLLASKAG